MRRIQSTLSILLLIVMTTLSMPPVRAQTCAGFTTQLGRYKHGKVVTAQINIRQEPGGDVLGTMRRGDVFLIIGGARCADDLTWWQVQIGDTIGWSAEVNNTGRLLAPVSGRRQSNSAVNGQSNGFGGDSLIRSACDNVYDSSQAVQAFTYSEATQWLAQSAETTLNLPADDLRGATTLGYLVEACTTESISSATATYLQTGMVYDASPEAIGSVTSVRLPPVAYTLPGEWRFQINDFALDIVIPTPTSPVYTFLDANLNTQRYTLFLGGFQPNEQIIMVNIGDDNGNGVIDGSETAAFESEVDERGYLLDDLELPFGLSGMTVIVGDQGSRITRGFFASGDDTLVPELIAESYLAETDIPDEASITPCSVSDNVQPLSEIPALTRTLEVIEPPMTGIDVQAVQQRLCELGYEPGPIDGIYGPVTEAAVLAFQADNLLKIDGIVGPITWGALLDP
jgi:hypothetical protein